MSVFPRSPKDSRKIVKMKREVPVAQFAPLEAPSEGFAVSGPAPRLPATRWIARSDPFLIGPSKVSGPANTRVFNYR